MESTVTSTLTTDIDMILRFSLDCKICLISYKNVYAVNANVP